MAFNEATCLIIGALQGPDTATWWDCLYSLFWKLQQLSPSLGPGANLVALSNGTRGTKSCTYTYVWPKLASEATPLPLPLELKFETRRKFGMLSPSIEWTHSVSCDTKGSSLHFQHSLCCDCSFILFGSNLPARLAGNKGFPSHAKNCSRTLISPGDSLKTVQPSRDGKIICRIKLISFTVC